MFVLLFTIITLSYGATANGSPEAMIYNKDYEQIMKLDRTYFVHNPDYPEYYKPGTSYRWKAYAPAGCQITFNCTVIQIPDTNGCKKQNLSIYSGNSTDEYPTDIYCGEGKFSSEYKENTMIIVLQSDQSSVGGRFECTISAYLPKTPSECTCGIRKKARAIGGVVTEVNEYPMMAAVLSNENYLHCGAVIISERYLITTANCSTKTSLSDTRVLVGDHDIFKGGETTAARVYQVAHVRIHEKYNKKTGQHNIAIIKTATDMYFSAEVMPVCLPFKYKDYSFIGEKLIATGWGKMKKEQQLSAQLNKVELDVVPNAVCENFYGISLNKNSFCTYTPYKSSCEDDAGGPLLYEDETYKLFLTGIIVQEKVCDSMAPDVNIKVTMYLDWITDNTKYANFCRV